MKTFRQFIELVEGKKKKNEDNTPVNAVPGTYQEHPDGSKSYTLKPPKPLKKPLSKKKIFKLLNNQGGIGGGAIRKAYGVDEAVLGAGENYGSSSYQKRLQKEREEAAAKRRNRNKKDADDAWTAFRTGGMIAYKKVDGVVRKGRIDRDGQFTPDADN